jgi:hypothetical protein
MRAGGLCSSSSSLKIPRHSGKFAFLPFLAKMRIYPESHLVSFGKKENGIPHKRAFCPKAKSTFCGMTKILKSGKIV